MYCSSNKYESIISYFEVVLFCFDCSINESSNNIQSYLECDNESYGDNTTKQSTLTCTTILHVRKKPKQLPFARPPVAVYSVACRCWCGSDDEYDRHGRSSFCNVVCNGDDDQTCGGHYAVSIYSVEDH